ncbi:CD209 antigen-like protein C [Micropterus dolomieu]|uniref:CD209 antigen-like protein C n=1 Tax=Micropterus dolomieu TaxID=147949 RepID=UPI001E8E86C2|nr:CD209 antigen-like protein C [Micropterus dolomieu]
MVRLSNLDIFMFHSIQGFQRRKQPSRCMTVCLGFLCAVLLADEIISRPASADPTQANYSTPTQDRLQSGCDALAAERKHYSSLWKDKEQLQTIYKTQRQEKEQLQTNYSSLVADRDQLAKKIDKVRRKPCQRSWRKFDISCYFFSNVKKNWTLARKDCISKGADLVTIESKDEQEFLSGSLEAGQNAWIGLTDSVKEGTWMWVDGTPVTTAYWQPGQPNSFNGNQDCGELVPKTKVGEWNDDGCFAEQHWICEN